jgi:hypothetical protein
MPSALVGLLVSHLKSALDFVAKGSSVDGNLVVLLFTRIVGIE